MERIACAALRVELKAPIEDQDIIILPCVRHGFGYQLVHELRLDYAKITDGFVTTANRFLNRYEAFDLAMRNSQMPPSLAEAKLDSRCTELYSEDLY